jgi:peptide deformylase
MLFRKKTQHTYYRVQTYGSPILHKKAKPIDKIDDKIKALASEMIDTMHHFDGIGLAGPQAGVSLQIVALDVPTPEDDPENPLSPGEVLLLPQMPLVIINPAIEPISADSDCREEGCLSLPGIYGEVERPRRILFSATTINGETVKCECAGLLARCLQHEFDHLRGKLFIDRMTEENLGPLKPKLKRLKKSGGKTGYVRVSGSK